MNSVSIVTNSEAASRSIAALSSSCLVMRCMNQIWKCKDCQPFQANGRSSSARGVLSPSALAARVSRARQPGEDGGSPEQCGEAAARALRDAASHAHAVEDDEDEDDVDAGAEREQRMRAEALHEEGGSGRPANGA